MLHRCPAALLLVCSLVGSEALAAEVFTHTASRDVTRGASTQLRHPSLANNPNARIFVSQVYGQYNPNPVGVQYRGGTWSIVNMNGKPIPEATKFNVLVLSDAERGVFLHRAIKSNIRANQTVLGDASISNNPRAIPFVTPVMGARQNDPLGVWWDGKDWTIYNQDRKAMSSGAQFNVLVGGRDGPISTTEVRVHTVTAQTKRHGAGKHISALGLRDERVLPFVTMTYGKGTPYNPSDLGLWFDRGEWHVFNEDRKPLPDGLLINVLSVDPERLRAPTSGRPIPGRPVGGFTPPPTGPTAGQGRPVEPPDQRGRPADPPGRGREGRRGKGERLGPIQIQSVAQSAMCLQIRPRSWGPSSPVVVGRCEGRRGDAQGFVYHRGRNVIRAYSDPTKCMRAARGGLVYFDDCRNKGNTDEKHFVFDPRGGVIRLENDPSLCVRASDAAFRGNTPVVLGKCLEPPRDATSWRCGRTPGLPSIAGGQPDAEVNAFCAGR